MNANSRKRGRVGVAGALALAGAVVVSLPWGLSHRWHDSVCFGTGRQFIGFDSHGGEICVVWSTVINWASPERDRGGWWLKREVTCGGPPYLDETVAGFGFFYLDPPGSDLPRGSLLRALAIPYWFAALALLLVPAVRIAIIRRSGRSGRTDLCRRCGYDLRASPARCPECGAAVLSVVG